MLRLVDCAFYVAVFDDDALLAFGLDPHAFPTHGALRGPRGRLLPPPGPSPPARSRQRICWTPWRWEC